MYIKNISVYSKKTAIRDEILVYFFKLDAINIFAVNPHPYKSIRISLPHGGLYDFIHVLKNKNPLRLTSRADEWSADNRFCTVINIFLTWN